MFPKSAQTVFVPGAFNTGLCVGGVSSRRGVEHGVVALLEVDSTPTRC